MKVTEVPENGIFHERNSIMFRVVMKIRVKAGNGGEL